MHSDIEGIWRLHFNLWFFFFSFLFCKLFFFIFFIKTFFNFLEKQNLSIESFFFLERWITFHNILQMLISKTVKSWKVIFVINYSSIWVFISCKIDKILGLLFTEFDTWCLKKSLHFFNFDEAFSLRIEQSKGCKNCIWFIRLKLLLF